MKIKNATNCFKYILMYFLRFRITSKRLNEHFEQEKKISQLKGKVKDPPNYFT